MEETTAYSEEVLRKKLAESWPLECILQHKDDPGEIKYIGMVINGTRVKRIYEDSDGDTWNKTEFIDETTGELLSEEEKIFGRNITKRGKKWRD